MSSAEAIEGAVAVCGGEEVQHRLEYDINADDTNVNMLRKSYALGLTKQCILPIANILCHEPATMGHASARQGIGHSWPRGQLLGQPLPFLGPC